MTPSFVQREFAREVLQGRHKGMEANAPMIDWRHVMQHPEVPDDWTDHLTRCMELARKRCYLVEVLVSGWATDSERRLVLKQLQDIVIELPYDCTVRPAHEVVLSDEYDHV